MLPELTRALAEAGLDPIDPRDPAGDGLAAGLVVLPADETNGLEFDSVIVVEPSLIASVGDEVSGGGAARGYHTGLADPLRRSDETHPAPGGTARGAAAGRAALTWVFGHCLSEERPPHLSALPLGWRVRYQVDVQIHL